MAPYTTADAVRGILTRHADEVGGNAAFLSDSTVKRHIDDAQAEINARLATAYVTPFDPVPALIKALTEAIAAYLADLTFRETREHGSDLSPILLMYRRAQEILAGLAAGTLVIPPEGEVPDPGQGPRVVSTLSRGSLINSNEFDISTHREPEPGFMTMEGWAIH